MGALEQIWAYVTEVVTPWWKEFKKLLIEERGNRCEQCNMVKPLDGHHLTYERLGYELPKDVVLLCRNCHVKIHSDKKKPHRS